MFVDAPPIMSFVLGLVGGPLSTELELYCPFCAQWAPTKPKTTLMMGTAPANDNTRYQGVHGEPCCSSDQDLKVVGGMSIKKNLKNIRKNKHKIYTLRSVKQDLVRVERDPLQ
jgi:hypothetical protein